MLFSISRAAAMDSTTSMVSLGNSSSTLASASMISSGNVSSTVMMMLDGYSSSVDTTSMISSDNASSTMYSTWMVLPHDSSTMGSPSMVLAGSPLDSTTMLGNSSFVDVASMISSSTLDSTTMVLPEISSYDLMDDNADPSQYAIQNGSDVLLTADGGHIEVILNDRKLKVYTNFSACQDA